MDSQVSPPYTTPAHQFASRSHHIADSHHCLLVLHHIQEQAHPGQHPLNLRVLALQLRLKHLLAEPRFRRVHRALVHILHFRLVLRHRTHQNNRHRAEQLLRLGVIQRADFIIPTCALQREAVNECAIAAVGLDLIRLLLGHLGDDHSLVQGPVVTPGCGLHDGREKGLRVEQTGQPNGLRG
ncbi:hypothetical protein Vafri_17052 [Volvox africanus]|uniref:Uncharacterized protein n=1 Tax=Volvox africanus TaxID=51714 RepID=A0A8J4BLI4_9CHLO|nr:hypothetical protein Vafri_17052 [Volvox africanus]